MLSIRKLSLIGCCSLCFGTNSPIAAQDISPIRRQYAEMREHIRWQEKEIHLQNSVEITLQHNVPGIGPQKIHYLLQLSPCSIDSSGTLQPHHLKFAEGSYQVAAAKFYEEFLYNHRGEIVFIYAKRPMPDKTDVQEEVRMYLDRQQVQKIKITEQQENGKLSSTEVPTSSAQSPELKALLQRAQKLQNLSSAINRNLIP